MLIGYARVGLTGTSRVQPGLREALAVCRAGDTLVATRLDRRARSRHDDRDIVEDLTTRGVKLDIGGAGGTAGRSGARAGGSRP